VAAFAEENCRPCAPSPRAKFHWFGYYDKLQFDPAAARAGQPGGLRASFAARRGCHQDRDGDLQDGDRWIELGETRAWNWQQGCMLQWLPGSKSEIIWTIVPETNSSRTSWTSGRGKSAHSPGLSIRSALTGAQRLRQIFAA